LGPDWTFERIESNFEVTSNLWQNNSWLWDNSSKEDMIDRKGRDQFIQIILEIALGHIRWKKIYETPKSEDVAIHEIARPLTRIFSDSTTDFFSFHGDIERDKNIGKYLAFLRSNLEFEWPESKRRLPYVMENLLDFLGLIDVQASNAAEYQRLSNFGNLRNWPFFRATDYSEAMERNKAFSHFA
jgi:hypothetical protein